jgi:hypothetical protein
LSERVLAFASLGVLSTAQQLASRVLSDIVSADPDRVAEETLTLVAVASAFSLSTGTRAGLKSAILDLPILYRDYLAGGLVVRGEMDEDAVRARVADDRMQRKRSFYEAHFNPPGGPSQTGLRDKMGLWMGRISPPGLEELPMDRLDRLQLVDVLDVHLRLLRAYAQREGESRARAE